MIDKRIIHLKNAIAQDHRILICPNKHRIPLSALRLKTCYTGLPEISSVDIDRTDLCCPECPIGTPAIAQLNKYAKIPSISLAKGTVWLELIPGEESSPS